MVNEESRIDLSSLIVNEDDDVENTTDEEDDDDDTSTDEEDDADDPGPPIHLDDLGSPPESILLDVRGYIDARTNATTTYVCRSTGSGAILVTFWVARRLRVSCFTVHCDGLRPDDLRQPPMVIAIEDDMVLLRVRRGVHNEQPVHASADTYSEYFVYQASGATSTLRLLPDLRYYLAVAGILRLHGYGRCGDGFLVAVIQDVLGPEGVCRPLFNLHLFDSRSWTWTSRVMRVHRPERFSCFCQTNVLAIGGERGSMVWVDLWRGILIYDLLTVDNEGAMLRSIPLLGSQERKLSRFNVQGWDMAVVQGSIKFFEMQLKFKRRAITSTTDLVTKCWKATTWEKADPLQHWSKDCGLDIFKVPLGMSHAELPSHLHDTGKLHGSQPALSLHEEDAVYVMAKAKQRGSRAWILAIDVRNNTL